MKQDTELIEPKYLIWKYALVSFHSLTGAEYLQKENTADENEIYKKGLSCSQISVKKWIEVIAKNVKLFRSYGVNVKFFDPCFIQHS